MVGELQPGDPARIGPYRLAGVLGSGGMGRVYLGRSPGGLRVAVKVIRPEIAAEPHFRARFAREVAAAQSVNGLYTAVVVAADPDGVAPWLATAYIDAPSLADAVRDRGPLPAGGLRSLAAGLAEGLAAIHGAGLVHRDLKPSNVLLTSDGPKIIDFGIARAADASSLTGTDTIVGSPGYMSPEQARPDRQVGPASDIFSLGAVLCYAASGHGPWGTGSHVAMLFRVVHEEPVLDDVPGEIRALVARCLAKEPAQRPLAADILDECGDSGPADRLPAHQLSQAAEPGAATVTTMAPADKAAIPVGSQAVASVPAGRRRAWAVGAAAALIVIAVTVPLLLLTGPPLTTQGAQKTPATGTGAPQPPTPARPSATAANAGKPPSVIGVYSGAGYGFGGPWGLAADGGRIWVSDENGTVQEVSAATGAPIQVITGAGTMDGGSYPIVSDGTRVWVVNTDANSVAVLNAADGQTASTLTQSGYPINSPESVIAIGDDVYIANQGLSQPTTSPNITEVDSRSTTVVRTIAGTQFHLDGPDSMTTDGTHLWILNEGPFEANGSVTEIDTRSGNLVRYIHGSSYGFDYSRSIYYSQGHLWVTNFNGNSVTEINAATGQLIRVISGEKYQFNSPMDIVDDGTHLWIANWNGNSVTEIDATTGAWIRTLTTSHYPLQRPGALLVIDQHLWVANYGLGSNGPGNLLELAI